MKRSVIHMLRENEGNIKVPEFYNIKFSFNMSYFCHYYF